MMEQNNEEAKSADIYSLVRLRESDLPDILKLEKLCYSQPWTEANFIGELERNITLAIGLKCGAELAAQCFFWTMPPEIHLLNLAVHPGYRRLGLARRLIIAMLTIGHQIKTNSIYLEVRPTNLEALNLYKSLNFVVTGSRPNYYENGEEALLMTLAV